MFAGSSEIRVCLSVWIVQNVSVVCKPGKELGNRWIIPSRQSSLITRHINQKAKSRSRDTGRLAPQKEKEMNWRTQNEGGGGDGDGYGKKGGRWGLWFRGGGAFMHRSIGRGGSAGVFLEQSGEVLGDGERWNCNVEVKVREKMLC